MKRFLFKNFILLFGMSLGVLFFQFYWSDIEVPYYKWHYDILYKGDENYDCVIVGNSASTHGLRPSILDSLGLSFVNLSLNGANSNFYLKWYNNHFRPCHIKPDYFIINTPLTGIRRYEHDASYFPFALWLSNLLQIDSYSGKILWYSKFNFLRYRNYWTRKLKSIERELFDYSDYDKGYVTYLGCPSDFQFYQPPTEKEDKHMIDALKELIVMVREDSIEILFVTPPIRNPISDSRVRLNKLTSIIAANYGIRHFNYQENAEVADFLSNPQYFTDNLHLSRKGSKVFSSILREDLRTVLDYTK